MRKPPYIPTSKQGNPEVDAAQFFDIDGIGMEYAGELLVKMKIAKFAAQTWPKEDYSFRDWLFLCMRESDELRPAEISVLP